MAKSIATQNVRRGGQNTSLWLAISLMSVVLLILTNSTPAFSDTHTSSFKPHPSSGKYSAIACRSTGNNAPIQFSGNAATAARTFLSPAEIIGGNLRSNADIKISGNGFINGDATPAPGHIVNKTGNATVTGSIQPATELLDCSIGDLTQLISWVQQNNNNSSIPPTDQGRMPWGCGSNPPPNDPWQFCLKGNETIHLSGGIYWFSSWSQSGNSKIIIDGYVRILITGNIGLSGNLSINAEGNPYNLLIFAIPDNSFSLQMSGNTILYGLIYGPAIAAQLSGQSTINGNLITQDINASGQAKLKRWIDETAPEINLTAPTATCLNSQNITASLTITDNESGIDPESIYLYLDGNPVAISANPADSSWHSVNVQAALSGLSEGNHQFISKTWDRAGNMSQKSFDFFVDRIPPSIAITFPADGAVVQQTQIVIMGVASDNAMAECGLSVSVNGIPVVFEDGGQWLTTITLNEGETKIIEAVATDGSGNSSSYSISISNIMIPEPLKTVPMSLTITDSSGHGNGVFENNESPIVNPFWANVSGKSFNITGLAGDWSGPSGTYLKIIDTSNYDTVPNHDIKNCINDSHCYQLQITNYQKFIHMDARLHEILTVDGQFDGSYDWPVHIGNSFTDIPPTNSSYKEIETLLHYGINPGCDVGKFNCPPPSSPNLTRGTLAMWLARAIAMGEGNVPFYGIIPSNTIPEGIAWGCLYDSTLWNPYFYDFDPNKSPSYYYNLLYCKYAHYLNAAGIIEALINGECSDCTKHNCCPIRENCFCPSLSVTREEMAKAIAWAITMRDDFIRYSYTDPTAIDPTTQTHKHYSCDYIADTPPIMPLKDVLANDHYCRHIHYLWAKDIIEAKSSCVVNPGSCSGSCFCPNDIVTREEFAKILVRAFQLDLYKANISRESVCAYSGNLSWGQYDLIAWPDLSDAGIDRVVNLASGHGFGRGFRIFINFHTYKAGDVLPISPYKRDMITNKYDLTQYDPVYWDRVRRLINSMKIAGIKKTPIFTIGHRFQCFTALEEDINTYYAGPWCTNNNTYKQFYSKCPALDQNHLNCKGPFDISQNWILYWDSSNFTCQKAWITCEYANLAWQFMQNGADTIEIYNEADASDTNSIDAHKDLISMLRDVRPGLKIQVSFNPPKSSDCDSTEDNSKTANFYDSDLADAWNIFAPENDSQPPYKVNRYRADYFSLHSIEPKHLGKYPNPCQYTPCADHANCPYIPDYMKQVANQFGENKLELSTDGQHHCTNPSAYVHNMDGEILQGLMNLPLYGNLTKGINFEYNVDAEGMQGFEKMKNVCSRNDNNVIADIKAYCREDGPICFTPDNGLKCSSDNPVNIDIIWTSINADNCTVTPKKPAWQNSLSGAHSFTLTQQKTIFTLDRVKDGVHSSDSVTVYCKDKDGQDVCPANAP